MNQKSNVIIHSPKFMWKNQSTYSLGSQANQLVPNAGYCQYSDPYYVHGQFLTPEPDTVDSRMMKLQQYIDKSKIKQNHAQVLQNNTEQSDKHTDNALHCDYEPPQRCLSFRDQKFKENLPMNNQTLKFIITEASF